MIALFLSPLYVLINIYLVRWLLKWMGACHRHFKKNWVRAGIITIYILFAAAMGVGFLLPDGWVQRMTKMVGNYWLGVILYVIFTVAIADLIRVILRRCKWVDQERLRSTKAFVAGGLVCILVIASLSIWGVINAKIIHTTDYEVAVDKQVENLDSLNVVLVADLHLGYNIGCSQMKKMVEKINRQDADLVVIAGDIFDNEYEALDDPEKLISILKGIKSKHGIYACYGNHDIQEKLLAGFSFNWKGKKESDARMDQFVEKAGITLLRDQGVLINDQFYLYGRADRERPGRGISERKTPAELTADMDKSKPILVLDHEPDELQALADAGVDVDLCGHTHDGQMFPGTLIINLFWENACGYLKKGSMHNIVTSGVGVYGPNMRVGARAEICDVRIAFE